MPRYFFHIADGKRLLDTAGIVMPDDAIALEYAKAYSKTISRFHRSPTTELEVTDENGGEIFRLPLHGQSD